MAALTELQADIRSAYRAAGRSPETIKGYCTVLGLLDRHLSGDTDVSASRSSGDTSVSFDLDSLTPQHIEGFLSDVRERGGSSVTVRSYFLTLRAAFRFAVRRHLLDSDPTSAVQPPRATRKVQRVLSADEVERLLSVRLTASRLRDTRDTAMTALMAFSGLRRSEVIRLTVADIDLTLGTVHIRAPKNGRDRIVPVTDRTRVLVRAYLRERSRRSGNNSVVPSTLFLGRGGRPMTGPGLTQVLRARATAAGLDYARACHSLRHFAAHTWLAAGVSDLDVLYLGGWTSLSMLAVYGAGRRQERALDAFRRLVR